MDPATRITSATETYDDFLGRFVDEAQTGEVAFDDLEGRWLAGCRAEWRDRFRADLSEIETLLATGAFSVGDAA